MSAAIDYAALRATIFRFTAMTFDDTSTMRRENPAGFAEFFQAVHSLYTNDEARDHHITEANITEKEKESLDNFASSLPYITWYHYSYVRQLKENTAKLMGEMLATIALIRMDLIPTILTILGQDNEIFPHVIQSIVDAEQMIAQKYFKMTAAELDPAILQYGYGRITVDNVATALDTHRSEYLIQNTENTRIRD